MGPMQASHRDRLQAANEKPGRSYLMKSTSSKSQAGTGEFLKRRQRPRANISFFSLCWPMRIGTLNVYLSVGSNRVGGIQMSQRTGLGSKTTEASMKGRSRENSAGRLGLMAVLISAAAFLASPAAASTVTYDFSSGASATNGSDTSTFSGYFTYDTGSGDVTAPIGITVVGTDGGLYNTLIAGGNAGLYIATSTTTGDQIDIYLAQLLNGTSPDDLSTVYWGTISSPPTASSPHSTTEMGFVSPTPLPATLPLFAGGLGFVGYLTGRKKRKIALGETMA